MVNWGAGGRQTAAVGAKLGVMGFRLPVVMCSYVIELSYMRSIRSPAALFDTDNR